jgi:hypothetical protein
VGRVILIEGFPGARDQDVSVIPESALLQLPVFTMLRRNVEPSIPIRRLQPHRVMDACPSGGMVWPWTSIIMAVTGALTKAPAGEERDG